jgi:hypothetical protein
VAPLQRRRFVLQSRTAVADSVSAATAVSPLGGRCSPDHAAIMSFVGATVGARRGAK